MLPHQNGRVRIVYHVSAQMGNLLNDLESHQCVAIGGNENA
jgi:hypothetical protein